MNKKINMGKTKSPLQLVTIGLLILFAILVLVLFYRIADYGSNYSYTTSEILRSMDGENYPEVADMAHYDKANGVTGIDKLDEFLALARYYEASVVYHAYEGAGDTEKADRQQEIMQEYYDQLSDEDIIKAADSLK